MASVDVVGATWILKASHGIGMADLLLMIVMTKWNDHVMINHGVTVPAACKWLVVCYIGKSRGRDVASQRPRMPLAS